MRALDENADAEPGAKAYFYEEGTSTPLTVYTDKGLGTPHSSPLVADADGNFAQAFCAGTTGVKVDMYDAADVQMGGYPIDGAAAVSTSVSGAGDVTFGPTAENPTTTVQDAIEECLTAVVQDTTPQLGGPLDTNSSAVYWSKGADVASATELLLLTDGNSFDITGTTTVATIEDSADAFGIGSLIMLQFDGALILTHHATDLILPGAANITTVAGDIALFKKYASGDWRCISYQRATGKALVLSTAPLLHVREEQTSGTDGGTFTSGAWRTRVLNTEVTNEITGASLVANQITLPIGTYHIAGRAPGYRVEEHQAILYNVSDAGTEIIGSSSRSAAGAYCITDSKIGGRFTIAAEEIFEIRHQCNTTRATTGLGSAASFTTEVFTDVMIWKVA
ncbi:MAG: hypothetical protein GY945_06115 [Rhodobacteraceae bacterium]|nr:hypothetical protein [Paracoccaceae bacterium]